MDGESFADCDEPTAAELAATEAALPEYQRRAVRDYWDRLIEQCYAEVADAPRPTSALLDGSAAERRRRRMERRVLAALIRSLPVHQAGADGSEAA